MRIVTVLSAACLLLVSCQPEEGCTDSQALNYNPDATSDDGSCDYGTSPNFPSCSSASSGSYFGIDYPIVQVGNQCWFAANLRTTFFTNGDEIPTEPNLEDICLTESPYSIVYGQDIVNVGCSDYFVPFNPCVEEDLALGQFGRLYNWYAVSDQRGLCPSGWHVADTTDWLALKHHLNSEGLTGTADHANYVMATIGWNPDNQGSSNQNNATGLGVESSGLLWTYPNEFSAGFGGSGEEAKHWTPLNDFEGSIDDNQGTGIRFTYNGSSIDWESMNKTNGGSVRCVEDGGTVFGCIDPYASNFDANANVDDGSCEFDFSPNCMNSVVHDSYTYEVVAIGNQCWLTENLKTTVFSNGDYIPQGLSPADWFSTTEAACSVFGGTSGLGISINPGLSQDYIDIVGFEISDTTACLENYGRLYNWHAAADERNLCPSGFHVPTHEEWETLRNVVDPTQSMVWPLFSDFGWYEMSSWGQNVSQPNDFNSMPGGSLGVSQDVDGTVLGPSNYGGIGESATWWSSTEGEFDPTVARSHSVHYEGWYFWGGGGFYGSPKNIGKSVRCIQD